MAKVLVHYDSSYNPVGIWYLDADGNHVSLYRAEAGMHKFRANEMVLTKVNACSWADYWEQLSRKIPVIDTFAVQEVLEPEAYFTPQ